MGVRSSHVGLKFFDWLLRAAAFVLLLMTLLLAPLLVLGLAGHGEFSLDARLDPTYRVTFADGRAIGVADGHNVEYYNFPFGREGKSLGDPLNIDTKVRVGLHDTDTRVVLAVAIVALLAISWFGLANLRRIVQTARAGDPFDPRNANRLRWIAGLGVAAVIVARVTAAIVNHTMEADEPMHVRIPTPGWLLVVTAVLGLLALAEVFREGAALRELERTTI